MSALSVRVMAAAVAGSALAATVQMAQPGSTPSAFAAGSVLELGADEPFMPGPAAPPESTVQNSSFIGAGLSPAGGSISSMPPAPQIVRAAELVDARLSQRPAEQARRASEQAARAIEEARAAADTPPEKLAGSGTTVALKKASVASAGGGVQMVVGRISSGYGPRWDAQHKGLDIAAPIGTPIRVPLDGTVISSGPASGFGLWVRVRHADGTITVYGHIDRTLVAVGQRVSAGEIIAAVGNRGQSSGPHLHFEVVDPSGSNINPTPWLTARGVGFT
ncbi:M23 family metallopeptidase [Pseudonocardia sp. RS010]|uniref:M23 family metallopeptidase n=1 Tax=Pseudonocardia sp. RS010 TaxID=3385979 RepID=UPI0039A00DEF